jgi:hypothetical protein
MKSTTATTFQFRLSRSSIHYSLAVVPVKQVLPVPRQPRRCSFTLSFLTSSPVYNFFGCVFSKILAVRPFLCFLQHHTNKHTYADKKISPPRNKHVSHLPQDVRHRPRRPVYPLPRSCPRPRRNVFSLFLHHRSRHPILRLNLFAHRIRNYLPLAHRHPSSHHLDFVLDFSFGLCYCCRALSLSFSLDFGFCNLNYNWDYAKEYSYPDVRFYLDISVGGSAIFGGLMFYLHDRPGWAMVFVAGAFFHNFLRHHFQERDIQGGSI